MRKKDITFTSVRMEKNTREMKLRNMSPEAMISLISRESKHIPFNKFRESLPTIEGLGGKITFLTQRIFVPAAFNKEGNSKRFASYNGLVLLSVGNLAGISEAQWVKRLAQMQPATFAAFVGSTGRSAKILVKVSRMNGSLPQTETEAEEFHRMAYYLAYSTYNGTLNFPITRVEPTLEQSFLRTFDNEPYFNRHATPLRIADGVKLTLEDGDEVTEESKPLERIEPGIEGYVEFERRFSALAMRVAMQENAPGLLDKDPERFITQLAKECCLSGFPLEEAVRHAFNNFGDKEDEGHLRTLFESVYQTQNSRYGSKEAMNKTQRNALMLRDFMRQRYVLRHNVIQDVEEYRLNTTWDTQYKPLDDRLMGKMVEEARLRGIDVWDKDIRRYVRSAEVQSYNPVEAFLNSVRGTWDGHDRIRELAATVQTSNPHWGEWFYRWFLSMTAQWLGIMGQYGNSVAPILIGRQGYRKSTFCRNLLPDELQFGYTDQLDFSSKKEVDRTICQYLLVNLDEFDQLSRHSQDGYLKNLLQRADIRARKPYKSHVSQMRRYASFIGTSNQTDILSDPSGSRRYLCVELTAPIDTVVRPNYWQLYAQAVQAVENGERYWFNDADVEAIMQSNRQFLNLGASELLFHDYFRPATSEFEAGAEWITSTALLDELRKHASSRTNLSLNSFGRYLKNLPGMVSKHTMSGTVYLIIRMK